MCLGPFLVAPVLGVGIVYGDVTCNSWGLGFVDFLIFMKSRMLCCSGLESFSL